MKAALCMHWREGLVRMAVVAVAVAAVASGVAVTTAACSSPDTSARVDPIGPSQDQFVWVAPVLSRRCGSIDCHGSTYRNMRVYGYGGLRLGAATSPDFPTHLTPEEITATYESVIGLEPEIMRDVVKAGGAGAERLTFLRKGRGDEEHKGHRRITPGDPSDTCITSWLEGSVDVEACKTGGCFDANPPSTSADGGASDAGDAGSSGPTDAGFPITQCL